MRLVEKVGFKVFILKISEGDEFMYFVPYSYYTTVL